MLVFSDLPVITISIWIMLVIGMQEVMGSKGVLVGGHSGWHVPDSNKTDFYNHWTESKRFHVGDSLRFQYENDSVLVVDKYGYYHCDQSKATSSYNDGNTVIKLQNSGLSYFISGFPEHCREGQRLEVDVISRHSSPAPESMDGAHSPTSAPNSGSQMSQLSQLLGLLLPSFVFVF